MVEKSPLQSLFACFARALNPVYMAEKTKSCKALFDKMLQKLVECKQVWYKWHSFSVNGNVLVDNMQMKTIVAQRKVND